MVRTKNRAVVAVAGKLERDGWVVVKRGWPTLLCAKGREVRLIVVKRKPHHRPTRAQARVMKMLELAGLQVELMSPEGGVGE